MLQCSDATAAGANACGVTVRASRPGCRRRRSSGARTPLAGRPRCGPCPRCSTRRRRALRVGGGQGAGPAAGHLNQHRHLSAMGPWISGSFRLRKAPGVGPALVCKWLPPLNARPSYLGLPPSAGLLVTRLPVQDGMPSYSVLSHTFVGGYLLRKVGIKVSPSRPSGIPRRLRPAAHFRMLAEGIHGAGADSLWCASAPLRPVALIGCFSHPLTTPPRCASNPCPWSCACP